MRREQVSNWSGDITSSPEVVVEVENVEELVAVLKDRERYPSPVRAVGSNHAATACGAADGGTLIVMRRMERIVEIRDDRVTAQAGARYVDVARELRKHGLQFHVNVELGDLTIGSAACAGARDASMPGELGQVASYATSIKMVTPAGELVEITEDDPELMRVTRSSHGLFGIIYEATFQVRPLAPMRVSHRRHRFERFVQELPALLEQGESIRLHLDPFTDTVLVELRSYHDVVEGHELTSWPWRLRGAMWSRFAPRYGHLVARYVPGQGLRSFLTNLCSRLIALVATTVLKGENTAATFQQIEHPLPAGSRRYVSSAWAFPEGRYVECLRRCFELSRDHYRKTRYRPNLLGAGCRIAADRSSLLSVSFDGAVMTFEPVSTGEPGWNEFLSACNDLCSELGGVPLLDQTNLLTGEHVSRAFGERPALLGEYRRRYDPTDRLLNPYFAELLVPQSADRRAITGFVRT